MRKISLVLLVLISAVAIQPTASGAESVRMAQVGVSGTITTPGMTLADVTGDGEDSILIGTSTGLYVFTTGGELHRYVQTPSSVTNIAVLGDVTGDGVPEVAISTQEAYFPNVQCYDIEAGEKVWEFSPKTEVYDPYILWTMKQTPVFDMVALGDVNSNGHDDIAISAGHAVYALDGESGSRLWKFQDTDNVWDLLEVSDQDGDGRLDLMAGDQNGYLYLISGESGEEIWSRYLAKEYTVIDPSTNSPAGTVKRSVWDMVEIDIDGGEHAAVSAEDGYVYMIDISNGETKWEREVIDYVDTLLYGYYGNSPLPTGLADYNFFNLRIIAVNDATGDGGMDVVASTFPGFRAGKEYKGVKGIYMIDSGSGEIIWSNENIELGYISRPGTVELDETYLAVSTGKSGNKDKVRVIDLSDGSIHKTLSINSTSGQARSNTYFLRSFGEDRFLFASSYGDLSLVEYPTSIEWSYPRVNGITIEETDLTGDSSVDMLVKSRDSVQSDNMFDPGQSRIIFVIDGSAREIAWSYSMPSKAFAETGGLYAVQVVPDLNRDGKSEVLAYMQYPEEKAGGDEYGEDTRVLVFNGEDGRVIMNRSVTDSDYYGKYDALFKDDITFNQTILVGMLKEMGLEEVHLQAMEIDQRRDFDQQYEEKMRRIREQESRFRISKRIESLDVTHDQSGDGVPDFLIGLRDDVLIMDSVGGKIVWNRTRDISRYEDPFTGEQPEELYHNWTYHDRNRFLTVGDTNGDGLEDMALIDWDGISFLHSSLTASGLDYEVAHRFTATNGIGKERVAVVGDLNGNGVRDLVFERYIEDGPSLYVFVDGRNGYLIMEVERSGTVADMGVGDFDGNGFEDTIIFQLWSDSGLPKLEIIDGRSKESVWSYSGIDETWMLRDLYGYEMIMPASPAGDLNGDGVTDVAVARSLAWQPGAEVLVYDAKSNTRLAQVVVEAVDETMGGDMRWIPAINAEMLADVNGDGSNELGVIMAVGEANRKEIKMFVVDIANGEVISDFTSLGSEIINLGNNSVGMVGRSGNIYFLDTVKDMSITAPTAGSVTGSPIAVEWTGKGDSMAMVLVDNKRTLMTEGESAQFEILSGEHKITVYSFDRYGKGLYDSLSVSIVKSSSNVLLVTAMVLVLLALLFVPRAYVLIKRV